MNQRDAILQGEKVRRIVDECIKVIKPDTLESFAGLTMKYHFDDGFIKMSRNIVTIKYDYAYGLDKSNLAIRDGSVYDALVALVFTGDYCELTVNDKEQDFDIASIVLVKTPIDIMIDSINYMNVILAQEKEDWRLLIE